MAESRFCLEYEACRELLLQRLGEPAPTRIQLLTGPRQVGKTTLLLEIHERLGARYEALDAPEAALPGAWERLWSECEARAARGRPQILLLDEIQKLERWGERLKGGWDRARRLRLPIHVVATGSSALRLRTGTRESLAGRFERVTLSHWSAAGVSSRLGLDPGQAVELLLRRGSYPGSLPLRSEPERWRSYVRDAIVEPALGLDVLAVADVRRPALLRQVFALAASLPAQVVSLQKLQGRLQDRGALETIAHYLELLEEAYLVASLPKFSERPLRRRAAPPKLVVLNQALLAATDPGGFPEPEREPERFGSWIENACLAHAWNRGQGVSYWREEPHEADAVLTGSWGSWAVEVKTGRAAPELRGLAEFTRRNPRFRPLAITAPGGEAAVERLGIAATSWREFLLHGPPGADPA